MSDVGAEEAILGRLARAHRQWREEQPPPPPPPPPEEFERLMQQIFRDVQAEMDNPEHADVVALRQAREDPVLAAIGAQIGIVGWRLYARGGARLLERSFRRLERDGHPGFVAAVQRAWTGIGLADEAGGVWEGPGR